MTKDHTEIAVTYCRVSSMKQVKKGDGLSSQQTRCHEYAGYKGYKVVKVFRDEGVSGSLIERPRMQDMLAYLKKHSKQQQIVVIIDDISRLARGLDAHIKLRTAISSAGGRLESPSIEFGEDPDSILLENLLASVSQHSRQKNAEQVVHRMRARVMNGYWCFCPIVGYEYQEIKGHGKLLVRVEPVATVITQALEGFASGQFETISEVKRFLEVQPAFPKGNNGKVHFERIKELCTRPLYAGYMDVPKWGLSLHPGKHEPLISFETWQKIQARLNEKPKAPARKDISEDFPLRGFVTCGGCDHPMTSAWSKGRNAHYPYYFCQTKDCSEHRKSIKRNVIEGEFATLLQSLCPSPKLFQIVHTMLQDFWQHLQENAKDQVKTAKSEILKLERKIEKLVDRIVQTENQTIASAYETQLRRLEENKTALSEKSVNFGQPIVNFDEAYRTAMQFLANPCKLWASEHIEDKRLVLRMAFSAALPYVRNQGYRTAQTTLPFKVLAGVSTRQKEMVEPRATKLVDLDVFI